MSPDFVYASSQWDMTLQCNVISHWLGSFTDWSLITHDQNKVNWANQVTLWLAESTQNLASSMVWYCTQFHCLTLGGLNKMLINFKSTNSIGKLREISFSVLATFHSYIFLKLVGDILISMVLVWLIQAMLSEPEPVLTKFHDTLCCFSSSVS